MKYSGLLKISFQEINPYTVPWVDERSGWQNPPPEFPPMDMVGPDGLPRYPHYTPGSMSGMSRNPVQAGFQMGLIGAGAGLGWAAIHRAIRLKTGNQAPVPMARPVVVGGLIGATLGTLAANRMRSNAMNTDAYRAFMASQPKVAEALTKQAGKKLRMAGTILNEGSYWVPVVGTTRLGLDAVGGFGRGLWNLVRGRWKKGLAGLGSGLANTAFAAASLVPGGGALKGVSRLGRLGRAARIASKGGRGAAAAARMARGLKTTSRFGRGVARIAGRIPARHLKTTGRIGNRASRIGGRVGMKGVLGGMALATGSGILEGQAARQAAPQAIARGLATQTDKYYGLYDQLMKVPTVRRFPLQGAAPSSVPFGGMPRF
jgi:hypothetical protein